MKLKGKWIKLEKIMVSEIPDWEGQTWYVIAYKHILAAKYRITILQSTDPERLRNKEGTRGDAWVSLGKGNKIDFCRWTGGVDMRDQRERGQRGKSTGRDAWNRASKEGTQ